MRMVFSSAISTLFSEAANPIAEPISVDLQTAIDSNDDTMVHRLCTDLEQHAEITPRDALRLLPQAALESILRVELLITPPNRDAIAYITRKLGTAKFSEISQAVLQTAFSTDNLDGLRHICDAISPNPAFKKKPPDKAALQSIFSRFDEGSLTRIITNEASYRYPNHTIIALAANIIYSCYKTVILPLQVTNSRLCLKGVEPIPAASPIGRLLFNQKKDPNVYFQFKSLLDCDDECAQSPSYYSDDLETTRTTLDLLTWACFVPAKPLMKDQDWDSADMDSSVRTISRVIMPVLYSKKNPESVRRQYYQRYLSNMHWLRSEMTPGDPLMDINKKLEKRGRTPLPYNCSIARLLRDDKSQRTYIQLTMLLDCYDQLVAEAAHFDDISEITAVVELILGDDLSLAKPLTHAEWYDDRVRGIKDRQTIERLILPLLQNGDVKDSTRYRYYQRYVTITGQDITAIEQEHFAAPTHK